MYILALLHNKHAVHVLPMEAHRTTAESLTVFSVVEVPNVKRNGLAGVLQRSLKPAFDDQVCFVATVRLAKPQFIKVPPHVHTHSNGKSHSHHLITWSNVWRHYVCMWSIRSLLWTWPQRWNDQIFSGQTFQVKFSVTSHFVNTVHLSREFLYI